MTTTSTTPTPTTARYPNWGRGFGNRNGDGGGRDTNKGWRGWLGWLSDQPGHAGRADVPIAVDADYYEDDDDGEGESVALWSKVTKVIAAVLTTLRRS